VQSGNEKTSKTFKLFISKKYNFTMFPPKFTILNHKNQLFKKKGGKGGGKQTNSKKKVQSEKKKIFL
jgi:hypothetical protein